MTATAAMARIANSTPAAMSGEPRKAAMPPGMPLTMPAKIRKLMPLPMPRSVISSPIHIVSTVPATSVNIWVIVWALVISNPATTFWLVRIAR